MTMLEVISTVGGGSGVVALLGAAVGYGRLQQRLNHVERDLEDVKGLREAVGRIDERTRGLSEDLRDVKQSLQGITDALLNNPGLMPRRATRANS